MSEVIGRAEIAVTVLGGYLGAGKTSVLNHILRTTEQRVVVLVNDFGSVSIDEDLIFAKDEDKITLANGCICCSMVDGLASALEQVRALEPTPDRLVIEASGVADPTAIAAYAHGRKLRLDGVITVVDAETVRARIKDRYVGDTLLRQIKAADLLVINKIDLIDDAKRASLRTWLSETTVCPTVESVQGKVALEVLLGVDTRSPTHNGNHGPASAASAAPGSGSPAADVFTSWSTTVDATFDCEALIAVMSGWAEDVVRAKAIVRTKGATGQPDNRTVIHRVGQRVTSYDDRPWIAGESRISVIGLAGQSDQGVWHTQLLSSIIQRDDCDWMTDAATDGSVPATDSGDRYTHQP